MTLEFAAKVLQAQPFSVLLGTKMEAFELGYARLSLEIKPELMQQHGFVHGGVTAYLADNALAFAGGSILGDAVTAGFNLNYVKRGKGSRLIVEARVTTRLSRNAWCEAMVYGDAVDEANVVAVATATIRKL